jgi:hypothetical protein
MKRFLFWPRPTCRGRRAGGALPRVRPDAGPGSRCVRRPPYLSHNFRTIRANSGYVRPESRSRQFTPACSSTSAAAGNPQLKNPICARICARDAARQAGTEETRKGWDDAVVQVCGGQHNDQRRPEAAETCVVWLITRRSQVHKSCPHYQAKTALQRVSGGPFSWRV